MQSQTRMMSRRGRSSSPSQKATASAGLMLMADLLQAAGAALRRLRRLASLAVQMALLTLTPTQTPSLQLPGLQQANQSRPFRRFH